MPLRWKIAPLEHMVVCDFEGMFTIADITAFFAELETAGALYFRKIFDATHGECGLAEAELDRLAAHTKAFSLRATPGPVAVVTGASRNDQIVTNFRAMTPSGRRLRMFPNIHEARQWLARMPLGSPFRGARLPE
jgi:hypothetical protein